MGLLTGLAVYTLVGFLLTPWLIERGLKARISEISGHELTIEAIFVNPFTLEVKLNKLSLKKETATQSATINRVSAKIHIVSIIRGSWIIRELTLDEPGLVMQVSDSGKPGIAPLASALSNTTSAILGLFEFDIERLTLNRGRLFLAVAGKATDSTKRTLELTEIEIFVEDLSTKPGKQGNFKLTATLNESAHLSGNGWLSPKPATLDAGFALTGLQAKDIKPFIAPDRTAEITSGWLTINTRVIYTEGSLEFEGNIKIQDAEITDTLSDKPILTAKVIFASGISQKMNLAETSSTMISVEELQLSKPHLTTGLDAASKLTLPQSLISLLADPAKTEVAINKISISDGSIDFTDSSLSRPIVIPVDRIDGTITQQGSGSKTVIAASLYGRFNQSGRAHITTSWLPYDPGHSTAIKLKLHDIKLQDMSSHFARFSGREITSGNLELELDYQISNNLLKVTDHFVINDLELGKWINNDNRPDNSPRLPLDMAKALLKDEKGSIDMVIPVPSRRIDTNVDLAGIFTGAFNNYIKSLVEDPFAVIAGLVGREGEYSSTISFRKGSAALTAPIKGKLTELGGALKQRPGLCLKVIKGFDPVADKNALAHKQVRLHIALATSAGPPGRDTGKNLDFNDPKVKAILDEFAANRMKPKQLAAVGSRYPDRDVEYYRGIFRTLVVNEEVSEKALSTLASYRTRSVIDQLVNTGVNSKCLGTTDEIRFVKTHSGSVVIGLELYAK